MKSPNNKKNNKKNYNNILDEKKLSKLKNTLKNNLSYDISEKISYYIQLLLKWNKKINLVSSRDKDIELLVRHIFDAVSLLEYIPPSSVVIDAGSGNGIPGIILGIFNIKKIILVESIVKKSIFLHHAALKLKISNVEIINSRIEDLNLECDILTAKAFSSIDKLLTLTKHTKINQKILLLKGEMAKKDIQDAQKNHKFKYDVYSISNKGNIVSITK